MTMSEPEETRSALQQVSDALVDVRNEAIVQTANLYILGRKVVLVGIGMTFLGVDTAQAFVQRAVERGEIAEADAQKLVAGLRAQAGDQARAADQVRVDMTEAAIASLFESVNGILRTLKVREVTIRFSDKEGQSVEPGPDETTAVQ